MKLSRSTLAIVGVAFALVAGIAGACGEKASATNASAGCHGAKAAGCQGAKVAGKGCCAAARQAAKVAESTDPRTCTFRPGTVSLKGRVMCNHCDLHASESCQTMFLSERGCIFTLAGDQASTLREEAGGGKALVRVKGTVGETGELTVKRFQVIRSLAPAASVGL